MPEYETIAVISERSRENTEYLKEIRNSHLPVLYKNMTSMEIKMENIGSKIDSIHEKVSRIESQTIRTNGRVGRLEQFRVILITILTVLVVMSAPNLLTLVKLFTGL